MLEQNTKHSLFPGFVLRYILQKHRGTISQIAWSPNKDILATSSFDRSIRLWNAQTGKHIRTFKGDSGQVFCIAWSPDGRFIASGTSEKEIRLWDVSRRQYFGSLTGHTGQIRSIAWSLDGSMLASGSEDKTIRLWNLHKGSDYRTLTGHSGQVFCIAWSPDGRFIASGSLDKTILLWDGKSGKLLKRLSGSLSQVLSIAWSPDGSILASGSDDTTIQLWDPSTGRRIGELESHIRAVTSLSFSHDGRLLASVSSDGMVYIWRTDIWEVVSGLRDSPSSYWLPSVAFHPNASVLATLDEANTGIRVWDVDIPIFLRTAPATSAVHYANAKVVLVGDSGVGKSGLGLVLIDQPFAPTESSHGRHVWTFANLEETFGDGRRETREILIWDLAGQPGYRLIHQLHLNEVTVALVVFDSHSETDPFAGVYHWVRALRMAERVQDTSSSPIKKFLVAARIDLNGSRVSHERIDALVRELGFDRYFETSAKEGQNIATLAEAIKRAIDWDMLPKVTSNDLFQRIKASLVAKKEAKWILSISDILYRDFMESENISTDTKELRVLFDTCIVRVESQGLIRRLSFGGLVLLQPELLDIYASSLVNAVKDEPDGLGSISQERVLVGDFTLPKDERLADKEQEKLLLIAMVGDLLRYEIALREQGEDRLYLVFPSQSTRENHDIPDPEGKTVVFDFEGPVLNIYTTLVVRLSHSGMFKKKELWKDAVTYTARVSGICGIFLENIGEGRGKLTLFFDETTSEETRFYFEDYVQTHLLRRALPESIKRLRIFACPNPKCLTPISDTQLTRRRELGFDWIRCNVCDMRVSLLDGEERLKIAPISVVQEMDFAADIRREYEASQTTLRGKTATNDFDVFLCHNVKDKPAVKKIGEKLKEKGILPWLDEWELRPGLRWQRLLEEQIEQIKSVAVFVSKDGMGPWQLAELEAFLQEFVRRGCPVIPVLLTDAPNAPRLPIFLQGMTWVDFREQIPNPMDQLIWGITGQRVVNQKDNPTHEIILNREE